MKKDPLSKGKLDILRVIVFLFLSSPFIFAILRIWKYLDVSYSFIESYNVYAPIIALVFSIILLFFKKRSLVNITLLLSSVVISMLMIVIMEPFKNPGVYPRDYGIYHSVGKTALFVEKFLIKEGTIPKDLEFLDIMSDYIKNDINCREGDYNCLFSHKYNELLSSGRGACSNNQWSGIGDFECFYKYEGNEIDNEYKIWARRFEKKTLFMYDSKSEKFFECELLNTENCKISTYIDKWK